MSRKSPSRPMLHHALHKNFFLKSVNRTHRFVFFTTELIPVRKYVLAASAFNLLFRTTHSPSFVTDSHLRYSLLSFFNLNDNSQSIFSSVPPCVATAPIVATNFLSTIFPYANLDTIRKLSLIALATFIDAGPKLLHMVPPNRNAVNSIVSPSFVLSSSNVLRDEIIDFSSCPHPPPSHSTFDLYHSWASSCNSFLHTSSHFGFTNFLSLSSSVLFTLRNRETNCSHLLLVLFARSCHFPLRK